MGDYSRAISFTALAAAALLWALPGISSAQGKPVGKARFEQYCSSCHGTDAKGDGPLAILLTKKPIDLTQLAKNNGGKFPGIKVMRDIDGRDTVRGHGTSDMPVWGVNFKAAGARSSHVAESATRGMAQEIVEYIKTIQEQ
ncbi:MAG TPA: c-type cytochrome [Candidatus Binataceae bacterium]|nr:c-type cytochrome [Candidatus Binataceae bacterium]